MTVDSYTLAFEGIVSLVLLGLTILLSYAYGTRTYSTWSQLGIPGPKPIPFLGSILELRKTGLYQQLPKWSKQYGKSFGVYFLRHPLLLTTDLDIIKEICTKDFSNFSDRSLLTDNPIMTLPLGLGLFFTKGQQWRRQRHTLSPTFSASKLKMMNAFICSCCKNLFQALERSAKQGKAVDVKRTFAAFSIDVIAGTGFGLETNSLSKTDDPLVKNALTLVSGSSLLRIPALVAEIFPVLGHVMKKIGFSFSPRQETRFLTESIRAMVDDRRRDQALKKRPDLLQLMMDAETNDHELVQNVEQKRLTTDEIIGQGILFFLAGFETTSTTLQYLIYLLTVNPEKQDKLFDEIIAAVGDAEPSYDNVMKISYLENCIRETLRLFPPVSFSDRKVQQQRTIKGLTLPAGSLVAINIIGLMRDEDFFPQPEKFLPERFEDEDHPIPQLVKEMPFGAGPRQCIGMRLAHYEIRMVIVSILRKFRFVKTKGTPNEVTLSPLMVLPFPEKPIFVGVEPRQMSP